MTAKKHVMLIALGVGLVGLSGLGSQKNPVERPFKGHAQATAVFTLDENYAIVSAESSGEGQFTHLGLVTTHGEGIADEFGILVLEGTMTAQNGEKLHGCGR